MTTTNHSNVTRARYNMRIDRAALRTEAGVLYSLPRPCRHHDIISDMTASGLDAELIGCCEQGFISECGVWLRRQPALRVAREAGQMIKETAPAHGLFSEDVW